MNISSEIVPNDGSNFSDYVFYNYTNVALGFKMATMIDIISLLLSLPTNSYVIWLIVTGTGNGLAAEFFSLNLFIFDIILSLNSVLNLLTYKFQMLLSASFSVQGLGATGYPLFQCLICVERYLAVVRPVTFLKYKPLRYKIVCSVFVWVASFVSCGVITSFLVSSTTMPLFCFILSQLIFVISIQLFCCVAVLRALKQSGPGERGREREEENLIKRRAFHVIQIITLTIVFIYVPYIIAILFFLCSKQFIFTIVSVNVACFELGGLVPPFLFLYRVGKLRYTKCL